MQLRKELDLYASLVNCFNLKGLPTCHQNVDIGVIRENTEGEYFGLEHEVVPGVVESLKVVVWKIDIEIIYGVQARVGDLGGLLAEDYIAVEVRVWEARNGSKMKSLVMKL
ncbi:isocitrate dehydrogenase [NAD] regulatory subunit 1, mitochondrial-like isoform X2 [Beta vulgaris subsp. vulgaris]|uniref:isocitrate dehydrogenase [NAD] regulatory subunit 1, mitochondrial-like isoform X2 n=1 Tax=Beta vulgaris subsp. vulgaris TaxID=3555 RepID=UPI0009009F7B|nr:isocitrate dehydrogenase [NAD] regulatory subunit 1, mitochondrial-like isoform X2 [Beta vulgaris subsp. vulgaris]